jgi:hypothetical protein
VEEYDIGPWKVEEYDIGGKWGNNIGPWKVEEYDIGPSSRGVPGSLDLCSRARADWP